MIAFNSLNPYNSKMIISKFYPIENLCEDFEAIKERCHLINSYFAKKQHIPYFVFYEEVIVRQSVYFQKKYQYSKKYYLNLENAIFHLHNLGIVHGDITKKNIIVDKEKHIHLIDFEPALIQIKNNRTSLMGTPGFIDPDDLVNKRITKRTDIYCLQKINF